MTQDHPECYVDEEFIGNFSDNSYSACYYVTKRMGTQAYDSSGKKISFMFPVFVKKKELHKDIE
jgi:hypothetical protein